MPVPGLQLSPLNPHCFSSTECGWMSWFLLVSLTVRSTGVRQRNVRVSVLPDFAGGSVLSITHRTSVSQPDLLSSASVIFSFLGCPLWFFPRVYFCVATTTANFSPVSCLFWTCTLQVSYGTLSKNTDIFTFPDCGQISSSKIP